MSRSGAPAGQSPAPRTSEGDRTIVTAPRIAPREISDHAGNALESVYLALSDAEAAELADALRQLQAAKQGWHAHVSTSDYQTEIAVYREDDETVVF